MIEGLQLRSQQFLAEYLFSVSFASEPALDCLLIRRARVISYIEGEERLRAEG